MGAEPAAEDKRKGRGERLKRCIRTAAGSSWEDPSLLEWDAGTDWDGLGQTGRDWERRFGEKTGKKSDFWGRKQQGNGGKMQIWRYWFVLVWGLGLLGGISGVSW